jgi:hypothetical protein
MGWMQVLNADEVMQPGYVVLKKQDVPPGRVAEREDRGDTMHPDGFQIAALIVSPKTLCGMRMDDFHFSVWKKLDRQAPAVPIAIQPMDVVIPKQDRFCPMPGIPHWAGYSQMYKENTLFRKGMVVLYYIIPGNGPDTIQAMKLDAKMGFIVDGPIAGLEGCTIGYFRDNFCPNRKFTVWRKQDVGNPFGAPPGLRRIEVEADEGFDAFLEQLVKKKKPFTPKIEKNKFHSKPLPLP